MKQSQTDIATRSNSSNIKCYSRNDINTIHHKLVFNTRASIHH